MNKRIIILAITLFAVMAMDAQNIIRPKVECPNGIYVNSYNGVLFYQRPDVSVTNRNLRLEAVFYYNSSSNKKNYGYGNGWSIGSELRFVNDSLGIIIEQGDGRRDLYTRYGNSFEAPAGVFSTLSFEGDGYLLTYKDGTKYYFADTVSKKVTQLKDRYDNAITYTYQNGNLATASDISGRSLYFSWNNGLLSGLSTSFDDRTWSYQYDEKGNLIAVTDPMGYTVHYAYNEDNRIKTFTDAEGYSTHITYNVDGMAHRIKTDLTDKSIRYEIAKRQTVFIDYFTDANNQYSKYMWDEAGRLVEIVNVNMGTSTKFAYDDDNNLIRREDANGHTYTYTYDQNGNCLSATDPMGYTEYYTYESTFNKVTSYTDKMGHYYNYQYDTHGDLLQMNGPLNYTISMTYNQYGQPLTVTDANGNTSLYGYDSYGSLISLTDPLGNVTTVTYNLAGMPLTKTLPNGAVSTFVYDNAECLVEAIDALNFSTQMQYDRKGNMVGYTDALNHTFTFSYDAIGQLVSAFSPEGALTRFYYSGNRMSKIVDALNHEQRFVYGDDNQLVMSIDAINDTIRHAFDNVGNLVGISLANGENIVYQYDALGRVVSASDQLGTFYVCHYDANNNVIQVENALGYSDYFTYDALGRLIQHTDAMGNSEYLFYDNKGNLLTYMDKNGYSTILTYDAKGNILTHTNALNYITSYNYNSNGNLVSVTDANGNTTTCEFDLLCQVKKVTFPNGKTRRFWYDGKGNITLQENEAGEQANLTYDAVDRLTAIHYVGTANEYATFQYDLVGNLIGASNQNATSIFTRDALGRLLSEEMNGTLTTYYYNTANRTVGITYPSGKQVLEIRDLRSRTTGVYVNGESVASFEYNNAGDLISRVYANGAVTNYAYDALGRMTQLYDNHNTIAYQLVYDPSGNLLARKDLINEEESQSYSYDALDRLVDYQKGVMNNNYLIPAPSSHISYGLDGLGNRTDVIENGVTTHYSTNMMNAYTSIVGQDSNQNMVYDDKGNMTNDGNHSYQYDGNNRRVSVDDGNSVLYKYDALGRMIQRQVPSLDLTENYHYARNIMIEENDDNGNLVSSFVYGQNTKDLIRFIKGNNSYFLQKDQLGSTTLLIDDYNAIRERYSYDPFGNTIVFSRDVPAEMPFLYEGNYLDDYTGSYNNSDRNYNTNQGRFFEQVTSIFSEAMNNYSYEYNNPTSKFDAAMDGISDGSSVISVIGSIGKEGNKFDVAGKWIAGIQGGVESIRLWDKSGVGPWNNKGFATFEDEYAADFRFVGTVLVAPLVGTIGAFEGAIRGGIREMWNQSKEGNGPSELKSWFKVLKAAWDQAINDGSYLAGVSQDVFEGMGREAGKARDQWMDINEANCIAFRANGSDYENATREQQKAYNIAQNKPTNEFYYMTGIPFSDAHAEKMMRRGAKRKEFFNKVKSWFD